MLSELIVKCVIGFGKLVRILENEWKGDHYFQMLSRLGLCVGLKMFFKKRLMYIEFDYKVSHIFGQITLESITQVIAIYAKLASGYGSNLLLGDVNEVWVNPKP
jgi:hypothetical protein